MRIRPEQLPHQLAPLKPCYCLHGDEPLLLQELAEAVRYQAKQQGFLTRDLFFFEGAFRWQQIIAANQEQSLFADKKIIELRIPTGKTGKEGSKVLTELINALSPDNILLIIAGKLDASAQKSLWYKAVDKQGVVVPVYPLSEKELFGWIKQRANKLGLNIDTEACELLASRTEGNLLATMQALEKFTIAHDVSVITINDIDAMVGADNRFTRFQLVDAALNQDISRALKILHQLRQEGTDVLAILASLLRDIRLLNTVIRHPQGVGAGIKSTNIWPKSRESIITKAASNHTKQSIQTMINQCLTLDRCAKGQENVDGWIVLTQIVQTLCQPKNTITTHSH